MSRKAEAKFLTGPTMGHVVTMTATGSVGLAIIVCFRVIGRIEHRDDAEPPPGPVPPTAQSPFTSAKGATLG